MPSASLYGAANALRSVSTSSNSPGGLHGHPHGGTPAALLVVPQPINASKMGGGMPNGTGRKYQCKMCPQVRAHRIIIKCIMIILFGDEAVS